MEGDPDHPDTGQIDAVGLVLMDMKVPEDPLKGATAAIHQPVCGCNFQLVGRTFGDTEYA